MRKNGFFTFVCACIPGCGQMYLGYMRRGVSLAFWFWGIVALAALLNFGVLSLILPVIWAFAFFDTFNIRALSPQQMAGFADDFIPNSEWLTRHNLGAFAKKPSGSKVLGWGLVIFGLLLLYNTVFNQLYWLMRDYVPVLARLLDNLIPLGVGAVVILLGIRVLRRPKKAPDTYDTYNQGTPSSQWERYDAPHYAPQPPVQDAGFTPNVSQNTNANVFAGEAPKAPAPPADAESPFVAQSAGVELTLGDEVFQKPAEEKEAAKETAADEAETETTAAPEAATEKDDSSEKKSDEES